MESSSEIIKRLNLKPHPEGGHYCETFVDRTKFRPERNLCSIIYYLLDLDEFSHWHRVDATECWFWHAGAPLALTVSKDGKDARSIKLGAALELGQRPHFVVEKNWWQTANSLGKWSLVSCMVTPAFQFSGFELADENWAPKLKN